LPVVSIENIYIVDGTCESQNREEQWKVKEKKYD